jgi:uncharacterized repeat protein (TIGR01451 family)
VNVERRWLGTSVVRVRILAAGLVLLTAGCAFLGWGSRSRQTAANAAGHTAAIATPAHDAQAAILPGLLATAQSSPGNGSPRPDAAELKSQARSLFAGLPLIFEPNQGQGNLDPADPRAKFVSRGSGYSLFLGSEGAILSMVSDSGDSKQDRSKQDRSKQTRSSEARPKAGASKVATRVDSLQMKLAGANPNASVSGAGLLPGKSSYFLGNDPAKWRHGIPQFARVRYENVYPGINLVFYGNQGRLEYDFQVAPGSDPAQAELEFNGAKKLALKDGALIIESAGSSLQLQAPRVYQEIAGRQQPVEGSFVLRGANRAGFAIGPYDHSRELVIDPILTFSTYFGGSGDELATSVAVDGSFNIYLTGSTTSPNLPTASSLNAVFQSTLAAGAAQNVYIAKITPTLGSNPASLAYVTYLGGNGTDTPVDISVGSAGDPFVAGTTSSSNFPTTATNAYQSTPEVPGTHVFVTELLSDFSTLQYSSYLSGNGTDIASGMAIDASGYMYVTGTTTSTDAGTSTDQFPASNLPQALPYQISSRAPLQFFVTKVNTNAPRTGSIAYSTYFGGGNFDPTATTCPPPAAAEPCPIAVGGGIAVDTNGNVYFTGTTNFLYSGCSGCSSTDFPILNAYQPCLDQAPPVVIVTPPTCTYTSTYTPTFSDAFAAKLNPNAPQGAQLIWSTYVGGTGSDAGAGIALDTGAVNVYIVGTTNSTDINTAIATLNTSAAYQSCLDQPINPAIGTACTAPAGVAPFPNDAFVARLSNPAPSTTTIQNNVSLNYFSYLGGSANEAGLAIAVDSASGALVTGWTQSTDFPIFPLSNPIQSTLTGAQDAFMARLNTAALNGQTNGSWANYFGGASTDGPAVFTEGTGVTIDVNQTAYFAGDTNSTTLQVNTPLEATNNGGYDAFVTQLGSKFSLSLTGVLTLGTSQTFVDAGNQATFTYTVTNNGPDAAPNITILDNLNPINTGVPLTFVSASVNSGTCAGGSTNVNISCTLPTLQSGATATVTIVLTPQPNSTGSQAQFNGGSVQATGPGNTVLAQTVVNAQMGDFTLSVSPANNTVPAGQTATYQVTLTPQPVYSSKITLACTGLPTGAACNFTNSPVSLLGPGSSTLNITTTARPVTTPTASLLTRHFYAVWLVFPGLTLLGVGVGGKGRRRRILGIGLFCALFMLLLLPACSTKNTQAPVSGTPAGKYTITVTGTSGSDTKSVSITLLVQ